MHNVAVYLGYDK
jgi:Mannitol repressor